MEEINNNLGDTELEDQAGQDQEQQEKWRQEYEESFLKDRASQSLVQGNLGTSAGIMGREAGKLADKETFDKFEKTLGKGAAKVEAQEHSMAGWMMGLLLAVAKDLLDMGTIEMLSGFDWILDIILGVGLFFLFGKSVSRGRKLITSIGATILEAIPVIGFLPCWTMSVAYMYFKGKNSNQ